MASVFVKEERAIPVVRRTAELAITESARLEILPLPLDWYQISVREDRASILPAADGVTVFTLAQYTAASEPTLEKFYISVLMVCQLEVEAENEAQARDIVLYQWTPGQIVEESITSSPEIEACVNAKLVDAKPCGT